MPRKTKQEKILFLRNWVLLSLGIIPLSYIVSLLAVLLVHGAFGFILTELISGIVLWQNGFNRAELRFIEANPLPESLIFACIGLLTGVFQWPLLKKHFDNSGYWIIASAIGWGIFILINTLSLIPLVRQSMIAVVIIFIMGAFLYGAITGATLIWIMKSRDFQK